MVPHLTRRRMLGSDLAWALVATARKCLRPHPRTSHETSSGAGTNKLRTGPFYRRGANRTSPSESSTHPSPVQWRDKQMWHPLLIVRDHTKGRPSATPSGFWNCQIHVMDHDIQAPTSWHTLVAGSIHDSECFPNTLLWKANGHINSHVKGGMETEQLRAHPGTVRSFESERFITGILFLSRCNFVLPTFSGSTWLVILPRGWACPTGWLKTLPVQSSERSIVVQTVQSSLRHPGMEHGQSFSSTCPPLMLMAAIRWFAALEVRLWPQFQTGGQTNNGILPRAFCVLKVGCKKLGPKGVPNTLTRSLCWNNVHTLTSQMSGLFSRTPLSRFSLPPSSLRTLKVTPTVKP